MERCLNRAGLNAIILKIVFALLTLHPSDALAQTAVDGAITGIVIDPTGAAITGATLQAKDLATGLAIQTTSGRDGEFLIPRLPTGEYQITISARWFKPLILNQIAVELGSSIQLNLKLQLASATTEINITEPDQPSTTAVASTITNTEIDSLPVNGLRWQTFALLTPTVNPDAAGLLSFRGAAVTQNSTSIDGSNDDQSFGAVPRGTATPEPQGEDNAETGGANRNAGSRRRTGAAFTFSQEAVREFRVSGQNYSALYGHAAGGVVTTVSKSGTNTLHGTGFYLFRTSALAAVNPFSIATTYTNGAITSTTVKPNDLRQQFGGSVGGAAIQDKLFYFYAYDQQRRRFPAISSPSDPAFYSLTATQLALLGNRGVTSAKINAALNYLDSLTGEVTRRSDHTINFGKLDWQASAKNRLSAQYDRARSSAPGALRTAPVVDRGVASLGSSTAKVDAVHGGCGWHRVI
jgi:Carboxypeptidase regulatory-like domain